MTETCTPPVVGVIGGSGIYDIPGLEQTEWRRVDSPFGAPSDELLFAELQGVSEEPHLLPSMVNRLKIERPENGVFCHEINDKSEWVNVNWGC